MKNSRFISGFFSVGLLLSLLIFSPFTLDLNLLPRFICLGVFLAISCYLVYRSGLHFYFRFDLITGSYLVYSLYCCISVIWAINKSEAIFEAFKTTLFFMVFLFSYTMLKMERAYFTNNLLKSSVVVFFILFAVLIYQFIEMDYTDKEPLYQLTALNGHKNLFSSFLFLNLFFLISAMHQTTSSWTPAATIAVIFTLILLVLLKTKAVWVGAVASLLIFPFLALYRFKNNPSRIGYWSILFIALIIANIFFLCFLEPIIHQSLQYNMALEKSGMTLEQERLVIWEKTYYMINKHPVFGVGLGNWQINFPDATLTGLWRAEDLNFTFQRPHNDFLWILSETGLIGLNFFFIFLFTIIFYLVRALKTIPVDQPHRNELSSFVAFIVGYFVISFFDFPKERIEHNILLNIIFAICYYHIRAGVQVISFGRIKVKGFFFMLLLVLFGCVALFGFLRYKGEFYTRKMFDYKNSGQTALLIKAGRSALSYAYTIDPTSMPINWYIGNGEALIPNHARQTLKEFQRAYEFNPFNENVLNDLASSYAINNNNDLAKKYYLEAARISPRFDDPKLNLVAIYINEKNYQMASSCINTLFHDSERRRQYQRIIDAFK